MIPTRRSFLSRSAGALSAAAALRLRAAGSIRVGMVPDAGATQVSIEEKAPLRDYLAKTIGTGVELIIPTNYNATVEALGNGSLDFAYLGALTYVKAHERYNVTPLVQRSADKNFHSLFITQSGSAIHKLADCKGKRFAFGATTRTDADRFAKRCFIEPRKTRRSSRLVRGRAIPWKRGSSCKNEKSSSLRA